MTDLDDQRRFAELAELLLDGELEAGDAAELRARLAAAPAAVAELRSAVQDHMLLRAALSPGDSGQLAMRTRYLLDSWRPASRTVAAQAVLARMDRRRRWARTRFWVGVAAAAVLLVLCLPGVRQLLLAPALPADAQAPLLAEVQGEVRLASGLALRGGDPGVGRWHAPGPYRRHHPHPPGRTRPETEAARRHGGGARRPPLASGGA